MPAGDGTNRLCPMEGQQNEEIIRPVLHNLNTKTAHTLITWAGDHQGLLAPRVKNAFAKVGNHPTPARQPTPHVPSPDFQWSTSPTPPGITHPLSPHYFAGALV